MYLTRDNQRIDTILIFIHLNNLICLVKQRGDQNIKY